MRRVLISYYIAALLWGGGVYSMNPLTIEGNAYIRDRPHGTLRAQ